MIKIDVRGTPEMKELLTEIAPRHALNLARNTVHGVAGGARDAIKKKAPKNSGTLKRSLKIKRRRVLRGFAQSDVIIERGRAAKADGFYWRFHEDGTSQMSPRPFVVPSVRDFERDLPQVLRAQFTKKLEAALRRAKKRQARK